MNLSLYTAISRLGLGLAVTLEFPRARPRPSRLATVTPPGGRDLALPALGWAGAGRGRAEPAPRPATDLPLGIGPRPYWAAACWASYILLNREIGRRLPGAEGLGPAARGPLSALVVLRADRESWVAAPAPRPRRPRWRARLAAGDLVPRPCRSWVDLLGVAPGSGRLFRHLHEASTRCWPHSSACWILRQSLPAEAVAEHRRHRRRQRGRRPRSACTVRITARADDGPRPTIPVALSPARRAAAPRGWRRSAVSSRASRAAVARGPAVRQAAEVQACRPPAVGPVPSATSRPIAASPGRNATGPPASPRRRPSGAGPPMVEAESGHGQVIQASHRPDADQG